MNNKNLLPVSSSSEQDNIRNLVDKYSGAIPRYTSYPTAVEFSTELSREDYLKEISDIESVRALALYAHVPFCASLCYFCACNKKIVKTDELVKPYLAAMNKELEVYHSIFGSDVAVEHFHWGGGTPNFISVDATEELYSLFAERFKQVANAERSVEVDPRTLSDQHLEMYRKLGFSRISAGVQDFSPQVQQAINRLQSFESTEHCVSKARELGFESVNLDLIYGLPQQTISSFEETISNVLELKPDRIALYGYAHVTWKKKVQKSLQRHELPEPQLRLELFILALKALTQAGYVYIGMDHFALPGDSLAKSLENGTLSRNFMGYTTYGQAAVLGVGVSAVSGFPTVLAQNESDFDAYVKCASSATLPISRGVIRSREDQLRAELIESVLCAGVIDIPAIEKKWDLSFADYFASGIAELLQLQDDGLVKVSDSQITVTALGRLFSRNIAAQFDAYLPQHRASSSAVFSQSV